MQGGGRVSRSRQTPLKSGKKNRTVLRNWLVLLAVVALVVGGYFVLLGRRSTTDISVSQLPCNARQDVTPFGDSVLYYDDNTLYCLSGNGSVRWSENLGPGRRFSVSGSSIVAWYGSDLTVLNRNGASSYKDNLGQEVQFARAGSRYFAAAVGTETSANLIIRSLDGTPVDEESEAFANMLLLDTGFYGDNDQYLWTLSLDMYGTAINTVMNTFQVGKMNTGVVNLGEFLAYKVLFENNRLRVFTTQQMYTYDYKAVPNMSGTMLVYGWQLVDWYQPDRGGAYMLLAPTSQISGTGSSTQLTELRVLNDSRDRRYHLPSACVGAAIRGKNIYAFSGEYVYVADVDTQRFHGYRLPMPDGVRVTSLLGLTSDGRAVLACNDAVYTATLPK